MGKEELKKFLLLKWSFVRVNGKIFLGVGADGSLIRATTVV